MLEFQQYIIMDDLIRNTIYFNNLDDLNYRAILRCFNARIIEYKKSSTIVNIGDKASNVYIIAKGSARSQSIDVNGKIIINRDYFINDIFGINYSTDSTDSYNEELVALEDSAVIICDLFRFLNPCQNRCKRHVDCMVKTFTNNAISLNKQNDRIYAMCQSKTRTKILAYLKTQANGKKKYFTIPLNQSELAIYLGLERSALSYELNKLKHEGIIDFEDKLYRIRKKI